MVDKKSLRTKAFNRKGRYVALLSTPKDFYIDFRLVCSGSIGVERRYRWKCPSEVCGVYSSRKAHKKSERKQISKYAFLFAIRIQFLTAESVHFKKELPIIKLFPKKTY